MSTCTWDLRVNREFMCMCFVWVKERCVCQQSGSTLPTESLQHQDKQDLCKGCAVWGHSTCDPSLTLSWVSGWSRDGTCPVRKHTNTYETLRLETHVIIRCSYGGQQKLKFLTSSSLSSGLGFFFSLSLPFFLSSSFFFFSFSGRRSSSQARSCWEKTMSSIFRTSIRPKIWGFGREKHRRTGLNWTPINISVRFGVFWIWIRWMVFVNDIKVNHWYTQFHQIQ